MERRRLLEALAPLSLAGCLRLESGDDGADATAQQSGQRTGSGDNETDQGSGGEGETASEETAEGEDSGGESGDEEETADEEEAGDGGPSYPRGLDGDGVSPLLADVHVSELDGTAYEYRYLNGAHGHDQTTRVEGGRARYATDDEEYYYRNDLAEELWTVRYRGDRYYGVAEYGPRETVVRVENLVDHEKLRAVLGGVAFDAVDPEDRDGETVFRITGETIERAEAIEDEWYLEDLSEITVEGVVLESGVVESLRLEFVHTLEGTERFDEARYEINDLGEATVSEPDWVSTAEAEAPDLSLTLSDDETYLRLDHEGGQTLPEGVLVATTGDDRGTRTDRPLAAGETLYAWFDEETHLSYDGPPEDAPEQPDRIVQVRLGTAPYVSARIQEL